MLNKLSMNGSSPRPRNLMLAQLPDAEYEALAKFLVPVDLPLGQKLSDPNQPIEYVYFLNTGLISTDAITEKGETVGQALALSSPGANAGQAQAVVTSTGHGVVAYLESAGSAFRVVATPISCGR